MTLIECNRVWNIKYNKREEFRIFQIKRADLELVQKSMSRFRKRFLEFQVRQTFIGQ